MARPADLRAVEVGSARRNEPEPRTHLAVRGRLERRVLGIVRLDPEQPGLDQLGNQRVAIREQKRITVPA